MKHQQVKVDYIQMLKVSAGCIFLTFMGWVLIRMVYAIFVLPRYLQDSQKRLERKLEKQLESLSNLEKVPEELAEGEEANEMEAAAEPLLTAKKDN